MKKTLAALVLILFSLTLAGCGNSAADETYYITSHVDCRIAAPKSDDLHHYLMDIEIPFCVFYTGEDLYGDFQEMDHTYEIGKEVNLIGENTDNLIGATLTIFQDRLTDVIKPDYYANLAEAYGTYNLNMDEASVKDPAYIEKIEKFVKKLEKNAHILTLRLNYRGEISSDVRIDTISIPNMNMEFKPDMLTIQAIDIPEGIIYDDGTNIMEYTALSRTLKGPRISRTGTAYVTSIAHKDIKELSVEALNDSCVIVTEENYDEYKDLEKNEGEWLSAQTPENISQGEGMSREFYYVINRDASELTEMDVTTISVVNKTLDTEGNEYWYFICMPIVCSGEYLMYDVLCQNADAL